MPAKRLRVEWSSDELVDHEHFDSDSIKVPIILGDPADFIMFAVRVSKGSALVGLVPDDAVVHDMKFCDQSAPEHGFFIKITTPAVQRLQLFGQDGTCKKRQHITDGRDCEGVGDKVRELALFIFGELSGV
mmetsp:Transcript_135860/g.433602  ORF Transcript_135860/g.433602 Transcript_135860/m.433602 type:complete len:131 (-) Transcript_135860:707-1099(-)